MNQDLFFTGESLRSHLSSRVEAIRAEINSFSSEQLNDSNIGIHTGRLATCNILKVPLLDVDNAEMKTEDVEMEADSYLSMGRQGKVKAKKFTFFVPFKGNGELFLLQPGTINTNPLAGNLEENEIILSFTLPVKDNIARDVKQLFDNAIWQIKWYLDNVEKEITPYNVQVGGVINSAVGIKKSEIQKSSQIIDELGFKMRKE